MFEILDRMFDERALSYSVLARITVENYITLVNQAHARKGNIAGQREHLRTTSSLRIQRRMNDDVALGAILPPVVIGVLVDQEAMAGIFHLDNQQFTELITSINADRISIIDGMQRTSVLVENAERLNGRHLRVEFWVASETASLTYRMLVLNTGQVPWTLRRQVEVIYNSLLFEIVGVLRADEPELVDKIDIYQIDEKKRRGAPGEFQADDLIEMYLAFGLRKPKVDTESMLADEFSKLDMIDAVSKRSWLEAFIKVFSCLCKLDLAFGRYKSPDKIGRFSNGQQLFDSQPVRIGFVTAAARRILGRPGVDRDQDTQQQALQQVVKRCSEFVTKVESLTPNEIRQLLSFDVLNELIGQPSSKVGDFERDFFTEAFRQFLDTSEEVHSLEASWRAL